ncbi:MAG TPA: LacI family DNA-binding transcriptional regulator [Conexibacter sp.]|jgi:DNA-binding LacI/PurR family transcriptional regulator
MSSPPRPRGADAATIFRVAQEAGVSITTVSHVFSGKRHVSEATRARVLDVAATLDYQPRASARALATRRSMTVALQHAVSGPEDMLNPFMSTMLFAMSEVAMQAGYSFLFVPPEPNASAFVGPLIAERRIDGAILVDPVPDDEFVAALLEHEMPSVSLGRIEGHPERPTVDHDHASALAEALEHLRARGYERPALMTLSSHMSLVGDTAKAFRRHAPRGAPIAEAREFSERGAYDAALALFERDPAPDAVYCINDLFATGVLRAARDQGIDVPRDLGIVGIGDSLLGRSLEVPLTSMRVYPERAGVVLFELLVAMIERDETPAEPVLLPHELVARASTDRG